jgi:hypothetical protein
MKLRISQCFRFSGLLLFVFVPSALLAQQSVKFPAQQPVKFDSDLEGEFRGLETEWMDAAKAQNRPRLEEFLAPGYVLTIAAGQAACSRLTSGLAGRGVQDPGL